ILDADGKPAGAINVFQDVTALKEAEAELRRKNNQLAAFLDTAALGLHRVGPDGIIQWANAAEMQMLGYSPEEYIGHHIAEFHADQPTIVDILKRLTCGETLHEREARLRCKDGSIKHVLIDSSVLWEEGKFIHTQCFTRDVTDR
ncbi:PAS domain-containing protein, partial [Bradyrhizobium sp. NBAIM08]|uniref:PAS domain-containing protein n=1 Tax=Bradyrhizobium sp. NBAIM08 TaxID=2793815 RepID=UPI001CD1CC52